MIDAGFRDGDKITAIDGKKPLELSDAIEMILIDHATTVTVDRSGTPVTIEIPENLTQKALASEKGVMTYRMPFVIDTVTGSLASKAALMKGDSLVAVNGELINMQQEVIREFSENKEKRFLLITTDEGTLYRTTLTMGADGKLGVGWRNFLKTERVEYRIFRSHSRRHRHWCAKTRGLCETIQTRIHQRRREIHRQLRGARSAIPCTWDWLSFWSLRHSFPSSWRL